MAGEPGPVEERQGRDGIGRLGLASQGASRFLTERRGRQGKASCVLERSGKLRRGRHGMLSSCVLSYG